MKSNDTTVAIEQLFRLYYQPVLRHLEQIVQQHESAEDICQETFLKVLIQWEGLRDTTCVRGWLYRIATNTAYDHLRRQHRIAFTALPEDAVMLRAEPSEAHWDDAEPVWDALQQVPEHYRIPLVLQSICGYSLSDIAAALGCIPATVKTRLHRARKHFRQHYIA